MDRRFSLRQHLRYRLDAMMSKGTSVAILWLAGLTAGFILAISGLVHHLELAPGRDGRRLSFSEVLFMCVMRALDPGTLDDATGSRGFMLAMFGAATGGIFFVGLLIGLLSSAVARRLDEMRKGRSLVIEHGHVVVLGWSSQVISFLCEMAIASEKASTCVVILADRDKVEMEDEVRARVPPSPNLKVVCRTGVPTDPRDLPLVNPESARSIVILADPGPARDAVVLKTALALLQLPRRPFHLLAVVRDPAALPIGELFAPDALNMVVADDLIGRVIVQASRQSGLSVVYTELLSFRGSDVYLVDTPALVGRTFSEVLLAYERAAPIGVRTSSGEVQLNPERTRVLEPGEQVIVVAVDASSIQLAARPPVVDAAAIREVAPERPVPSRTLVLGWNPRGARVLTQLDGYVPGGSAVHVATPQESVGELPAFRNLAVTVARADHTRREELARLDPGTFQHVIVLADGYYGDAQSVDAATLVTILHLRAKTKSRAATFTLVAEMLDERNRLLADVARADDYVVTDQLVSMLLAQMAENVAVRRVLDELLDAEGSEIHVRAADRYVTSDRPVTFATVVEAASRRGECAVGYRLAAVKDDRERNYGVVLNPPCASRVQLGPEDSVVVVALH